MSPGHGRNGSDSDRPHPDSTTQGDFIEGDIAPDFSTDEGEIVSGKSDSEEDWFKDALYEFEVKEVGEPISEDLAIFITKRFTEAPTEEKMKEKIAQHNHDIARRSKYNKEKFWTCCEVSMRKQTCA